MKIEKTDNITVESMNSIMGEFENDPTVKLSSNPIIGLAESVDGECSLGIINVGDRSGKFVIDIGGIPIIMPSVEGARCMYNAIVQGRES